MEFDSATGRFYLQAGEFQIGPEILNFYSNLQQVAFRFTANLVDPDSYTDLGDLLEDFDSYFNQAIELASEGMVEQIQNLDDNPIRGLTIAGNMRDRLATISQLQESDQVKKAIQTVQKQTAMERKLSARVQLLWQRLTLPHRDAPIKIAQAVAMVRAGLMKDGLKNILARPAVRYGALGAAIAGSAVLGYLYPESVTRYLYQSLNVTRTILDVIMAKGSDIGTMASLSGHTTTAWMTNPGLIYDAYLSPERLPRALVGISAIFTTLYLTLGMPHVITNTVALVKDLRKADLSESGRFKNWFITREKERKENYIKILAGAESKKLNSERAVFTPEDEVQVSEILAQIETEHQSWAQKFVGKIRDWGFLKKLEKKSDSQISTFRQALGHFFFSYASLSLSGATYTHIQNGWFALRSFLFRPTIWMTYLMYPKYMSTILKGSARKKGADLIVPSEWNGGTRNWVQEIAMRWKGRSWKNGGSARQQLEALRAWEDRILGVEAKIREAAIQRAHHAMIPWMQTHEKLRAWTEERPDSAYIDAEQLDLLSKEQRLVFRLYSEELFDSAMTSFLKSLARKNGAQIPVDLELTPGRLKELTLAHIQELAPETVDADALVRDDGTVFERIKKEAKERLFSPRVDAAKIAFRDHFIAKVDPDRNPQVSRLMSVARQMKDPLAMGRAVRSMIAANVIDKPLGLILNFLCFAGITSGFLMPIQDQMFSSDSWFYLSKYIFGTGYLTGVIMGVLGDVWYKLQQDEFHNDDFGQVPEGPDAKKGFFSWYLKKAFADPKNSWWKNEKQYLRIIWANMPAAFVLMMATNLLTLGRFDLDIYLMGYLSAYLLPLGGFSMKVEQGFELAAYYDLKDFPEKLRSHPRVLEFFNKKVTKRRLVFNIFDRIYTNLLGSFLTNFEHMTTAQFGTRSLSRIIFGGNTPTEWVYLGIQKIDELFGWMPAVKGVTHTCASLLTHNYTGSKIIPAPQKP